MRAWQRAAIGEKCGRCGAEIPRGQPMLVIRPTGIKRRFIRCLRRACAEERPPAELPDLPEALPIQPMVPIRTGLGALPFDYKSAAAGERDDESFDQAEEDANPR